MPNQRPSIITLYRPWRRAIATGLALLLGSCASLAATNPKLCLLISSYHPGYAWSDGVERGLRPLLSPHCRLEAFYMDSKRHKSEMDIRAAAQRARDLIDTRQPDVVITADDWLRAFARAQDYDLLILGGNAGIPDWDPATMTRQTHALSRRLSVTNSAWMMPYAMLGLTKVAEEQGEWATRAAIAILDGKSPGDIPIVANQRWDVWINPQLLAAVGVQLPPRLVGKAKQIATPAPTPP